MDSGWTSTEGFLTVVNDETDSKEMVTWESQESSSVGSFWAGRGPGAPHFWRRKPASTRPRIPVPFSETLWGIVRKGLQVVPVNLDADVRNTALFFFWVSVFCFNIPVMKLFSAVNQWKELTDSMWFCEERGWAWFRDATAIGKGINDFWIPAHCQHPDSKKKWEKVSCPERETESSSIGEMRGKWNLGSRGKGKSILYSILRGHTQLCEGRLSALKDWEMPPRKYISLEWNKRSKPYCYATAHATIR